MRLNFNDQALRHIATTYKADKEGRLLYRKASKSNSKYKERWFKLCSNLLFYFKTNEFGGIAADSDPLGVLVLTGHRVRLENYVDCPFVFSVMFASADDASVSQMFYFSGPSMDHCIEWVDALTGADHEVLRSRMAALRRRIQQLTGRDPLYRRRPFQSHPQRPAVTIMNEGNTTFYETIASAAGAGVLLQDPSTDPKSEPRSDNKKDLVLASDSASGGPISAADITSKDEQVKRVRKQPSPTIVASSFRSWEMFD